MGLPPSQGGLHGVMGVGEEGQEARAGSFTTRSAPAQHTCRVLPRDRPQAGLEDAGSILFSEAPLRLPTKGLAGAKPPQQAKY